MLEMVGDVDVGGVAAAYFSSAGVLLMGFIRVLFSWLLSLLVPLLLWTHRSIVDEFLAVSSLPVRPKHTLPFVTNQPDHDRQPGEVQR